MESIWSGTVLLNVGIQVLNLVIFFLLFKFFMWDKLSFELEEREKLIKKLKYADEEYQNILWKANEEANQIIVEAKKHSDDILYEREALAREHSQSILADGEYKAQQIVTQAEKEAKKLEEGLIASWSNSLKTTSKMLVKKILDNSEELQDKYLDTLIDDLKK